MSIYALATGTVSQAPTRRTTSKGSPWVTLSIRVPSGEGSSFVNVAVFDAGLVEEALALREGGAVTVQGKLELRTWQGRDGTERAGLSITANQMTVLTKPAPKARRKAAAAPAGADDAEPFDSDAGDLDDVLPARRAA